MMGRGGPPPGFGGPPPGMMGRGGTGNFDIILDISHGILFPPPHTPPCDMLYLVLPCAHVCQMLIGAILCYDQFFGQAHPLVSAAVRPPGSGVRPSEDGQDCARQIR